MVLFPFLFMKEYREKIIKRRNTIKSFYRIYKESNEELVLKLF